jgi:hypothetical protein
MDLIKLRSVLVLPLTDSHRLIANQPYLEGGAVSSGCDGPMLRLKYNLPKRLRVA